jgi:hypothetical protein
MGVQGGLPASEGPDRGGDSLRPHTELLGLGVYCDANYLSIDY